MCVAMVIIHTKTLEKKPVDDVTSKESPQLCDLPTMSQGTALFSCGIRGSGGWADVSCGVQQRPAGSSLESLWDGVREACPGRDISGLLHDLSLTEAQSAPPTKRQCRSLSCSDELGGWRTGWRPQGSRVWTSVEKRRCHSGGSVQRGVSSSSSAFIPLGFPAIQRSSSFSLPARTIPPEPFSPTVPFLAGPGPQDPPQALHLSHEQICPAQATEPPSDSSSPDSTPELQRRSGRAGLARSRSQPCVHNDKKMGVKRRRPADSQKQRPSLDLVKMTQKLQDFHSLSCPGISDCSLWFSASALQGDSEFTSEQQPHLTTKHDSIIHQSDGWTEALTSGKERERPWAGLCSGRGRDSCQLGGELDIDQIERN